MVLAPTTPPYQPPDKKANPTPQNIHQLKEWLAYIRIKEPDTGYFYKELEKYLGPWGKRGYLIGHGMYYKEVFLAHPWLQCKKTRPWGFLTMHEIEGNISRFIVHNFQNGSLASATLEQELFKFSLENSHIMFYRGGISSWLKTPHKFVALFIVLLPDFFKQPIKLLIQAFKLFRLLFLETRYGEEYVRKSELYKVKFRTTD